MKAITIKATIDIEDATLMWNPESKQFLVVTWREALTKVYAGEVRSKTMGDIFKGREAWLKKSNDQRLEHLISTIHQIHYDCGIPLLQMVGELFKIRGFAESRW